MMKVLPLAMAAVLFCSGEVRAVEFSTVEIAGKKAIVARVSTKKERLHLFLRDAAGQPLRSFDALLAMLKPSGRQLVFACNAGMYHADFSPVGLFAEGGKQIAPLNLADDEGNFFLKPNGVFLVTESGDAHVLESTEVTKFREPIRLASQSGPLLLRNGKIHPAFKPNSEFRLIRNGVGIPSSDTALFVQTEDVVNLHEMALLFREVLKCPDALYFDGTVSSIYSPELGRNEKKIDLGPIIGVLEDGPTR